MRPIKIDVNGKMISGFLLKESGNYWLHVNGKQFFIEEESRSGKKSIRSLDPGTVVAPMPGKVIKVNVAKGDNVQQGDVVVVMEAMKMEYSLKAEIDGAVSAVNCKVGDQVTLGKNLAKIEGATKG